MLQLNAWLDTSIGKFLIGVVVVFLVATVSAFFKGYFGARGKTLATKHDVEILQEQLEENTKITKKIERSFSREEVLWITMRAILIFLTTSFVLLMPQASFAQQACKCVIAGRVSCYPATACGSAGGMCNGIWPLPAGDYAQSCHSCEDTCAGLTCVCKKANGHEQVSGINVLSCASGRLSNINGNLACGP
jgi:hypothetical protein